MKTHPNIKRIRSHNKWRRGGDGDMLDPKELGIALDWAIKVCELAQRLVEAKPDKMGERYSALYAAVNDGKV